MRVIFVSFLVSCFVFGTMPTESIDLNQAKNPFNDLDSETLLWACNFGCLLLNLPKEMDFHWIIFYLSHGQLLKKLKNMIQSSEWTDDIFLIFRAHSLPETVS